MALVVVIEAGLLAGFVDAARVSLAAFASVAAFETLSLAELIESAAVSRAFFTLALVVVVVIEALPLTVWLVSGSFLALRPVSSFEEVLL